MDIEFISKALITAFTARKAKAVPKRQWPEDKRFSTKSSLGCRPKALHFGQSDFATCNDRRAPFG